MADHHGRGSRRRTREPCGYSNDVGRVGQVWAKGRAQRTEAVGVTRGRKVGGWLMNTAKSSGDCDIFALGLDG